METLAQLKANTQYTSFGSCSGSRICPSIFHFSPLFAGDRSMIDHSTHHSCVMGSSDSGGASGLPDSSIGTIVWVRRRNGSWWPGKILGVDELSASHLMSPRSGTPVKLLGREDASVDWYNLEKSKRVKAFRCGEFDDCIERAEASLGLPAKKREKYARREDAILHALDLEKEILEKKYGKGGAKSYMNNATCGSAGKDLRSSSFALRNGNGKHESSELQQYHTNSVSATEDECNSNPLSALKVEGVARQNSFNSQCNRLGGLHDLTLPKKVGSVAMSPSHKATNDDQVEAVSAGGIDSGNSTDKGKGLLDGSIEESSIRRRDRRRPLFQVLQNSAMPGLSVQPDGDTFSMSGVNHPGDDARVKRRRLLYLPSQSTDMVDAGGDSVSQMDNLASHQGVDNHYHADTFAKNASSGSSEDTESDSSETDSMEHYMNIDMTTYSDINTPMTLQSRAQNSMQGDQPSTSSSESDDSSHLDAPHFHQEDPVSLDMGVSRWQLKGKRNVRSFSRRSLDRFAYGTYLEPRSLIQRPSHSLSYYHYHDGYSNEVDFMEDDLNHIEGYGSRGYMWKSQAPPRRWNGSNTIDLDELTWRDSSLRGYWGDRFGGFNSHDSGLHGQELLFDVDLKVQASHRREHVPFVSLMSRLNGKPIIGHPIQIETLKDGSTDELVSSTDAFGSFESDDGNRAPPAWTTARRTTSFRVPRPHVSSHLDDFDNQLGDQDHKSLSRSLVPGNGKKKNSSRMLRRKSPHVPKHPSSDRKKPPKRSSSSSSQKIRPLSSIGMDQNLAFEPRQQSRLISYMDGLLAFRLNLLLEAIGRPPSMPSSNKGLDRKPSLWHSERKAKQSVLTGKS
ncbi:hypothetical protein V2J09_001975 [Rumex salicifolius]